MKIMRQGTFWKKMMTYDTLCIQKIDFFLVIGLLFMLVLQLEEKDNKIVRVVWRHPGDDVTGMAARSEKIVNTCEKVNI